MTRGLTDDEASQQTDIAHRKAIFKGHRHYLGTELETHISTIINHPADEPGKVHIGNMRASWACALADDPEMIVDSVNLWNAGETENALAQNTLDLRPSNNTGGIDAAVLHAPRARVEVQGRVRQAWRDDIGRRGGRPSRGRRSGFWKLLARHSAFLA